ncbi:hypothetical protein C5L30_000258 [Companilactobacillus farciminis]|uniref:Uncharacterized protein n=1 Tax=Companilactobacillus farciminis TaxID=1612 RepID=A0A4R5NIY6_9LACO|nr:hypothetical protein [Companilactobacillus farciminis]ATO46091.1 hypothetical protein LF20184_04685 [Companilactobacillus farciminis KCTC 3681 = DSM 20184]KRK62476.1 hypothetical protein FC68_GL002003 [Companilactobacillus farciminis KCTC 3681 = DSM 20184]TDG74542.1 hypothetical protein C5L30_000258 [Companilactobacillus farciminis]
MRNLINWTEEQQTAIKQLVKIKTYYHRDPIQLFNDIASAKHVISISSLPIDNQYNYSFKLYRDKYGIEYTETKRKKKSNEAKQATVKQFNDSIDILHDKYVKSKDNNFDETTRKLTKDIMAFLEGESEFV